MTPEAQIRIEKEIENRTGLLDLRHCNLTSIPEEIVQLFWLKVLIVSNKIEEDEYFKHILNELNLVISYHDNILVQHEPNQISELPSFLNQLISLQAIHCAGDFFEKFHLSKVENISNLSNLEYLDLSCNEINVIEVSATLEKLKYLNLTSNLIDDINFLSKFPNLMYLNLIGNQISNISPISNLRVLSKAYLGANEINQIENIEGVINLETLDLRTNGIKIIKGLANYKNLKELALDDNEISIIEGLDGLKKLEALYLSKNRIRKITGLDNLTSLTKIDLRDNLIEAINGLPSLDKLQYINLGNNKITNIKRLPSLKNLNYLSLIKNKISNIANVEKLPQLENLYLSDNKLIDFESLKPLKGLFDSNQLKELYIDSNPFLETIQIELKYGENHILFLKNEFANFYSFNKMDVSLPIKILLLGNHKSGKSSLIYYIKNRRLKNKSDSTHILSVEYFKTKENTSSIPDAIFYDFGGQDFYHGIYRAFITNNALQIILYNPEINNRSLDIDSHGLPILNFDTKYWLGINKYHAQAKGHAEDPFIVIQTFADTSSNKEYINPSPGFISQFHLSVPNLLFNKTLLLKNLYKSDREHFLIHFINILKDLKGYKQISKAESSLLNYILTSKGVSKTSIPITQLLPYYTIEETSGISSLQLLKAQLIKLNQAGLILYYGTTNDNTNDKNTLDDKIWLNPEEFVNYIHSKILSKEGVLKSDRGQIDYAVFNKNGFDSDIIKVLEIQRVLFLHKPSANESSWKYIIPNYLPLTDVNDSLYKLFTFGQDEPSIVLKFQEFLPFGLINQMICFYGKEPEDKIFWRDQIVFTLSKKVRVMIHLDFIKLQINIYFNTLKLYKSISDDLIKEFLFFSILLLYWDREPIFTFEEYLFSKDISSLSVGTTDTLETESKKLNWKRIKSEENCYPRDLFLSLDGNRFIEYTTVKDYDRHMIISYGLTSDGNIDFKNLMEIPAYPFDPFTESKIPKIKKIFISYSHQDVSYRTELNKYLVTLERDNLIEIWQDTMISGGEDWNEKIQTKLKEADIVIMLVSQDFIASTYIHEKEVKEALSQSSINKTRIVPILIRDCDWENWKILPDAINVNQLNEKHYKMDRFQFLIPAEHKGRYQLLAVNQWDHPETAWKLIGQSIRDLVQKPDLLFNY